MQANQKKSAVSKFPLRLMSSVRRDAEEFSQREGVSLNQFINLAVAETLAHLQHDEWLASRPKPSTEHTSRALVILDRPTQQEPDDEDALPDGYVSIRRTRGYTKVSGEKQGICSLGKESGRSHIKNPSQSGR